MTTPVQDLAALRSFIVETMKPLMPAPVQVKEFAGRFDLAQLERYAIDAPCILVAALKLDGADGLTNSVANCAAYIVTKDGKLMQRTVMNLTLGTFVVAVCKSDLLASDRVGSPEGISYDNLFSTSTDAEGIHLGAVKWTSSLDLAIPQASMPLGEFKTLLASYDFSPADGVVDNTQQIDIP